MLTPLVKMHTLGHSFVPAGIHAGGLRYHGMSPLISHLYELGLIEAEAVKQRAAFESAVTFARSEGILPAPEAAHAIRSTVDQAMAARETGESRTILFGLSGHGNFDLSAFVTNATDALYFTAVNDQTSSGFVSEFIGEPRMYGVRVRYNF